MNRVCIVKIGDAGEIPDLGPDFRERILAKHHPKALAESLTAWTALACMLGETLPRVVYQKNGKPYFMNSTRCFSISHSGELAAVILSDAPCGIDIEKVRPEAAERLRGRCALPSEKDMEFFEMWTMKESIGKMTGEGMRPLKIDTALYSDLNRRTFRLRFNNEPYHLSVISQSPHEFEFDFPEGVDITDPSSL